jgi:hypothetical protein
MPSKPRRLLLVAYYFPPRAAIGSLRPGYLAHYLPSEGWDVTVLTADLNAPPPPWAPVVQTGYTDVIAQTKQLLGLSPGQSVYAAVGQEAPKVVGSTRHSISQRLILFGWRALTYPDPIRGWYRHAALSISQLLSHDHFDAILSTSPPVTAHFAVAKALKRGIPWLADLRDPWAENPYHSGPIRRRLDRVFERRVLAKAKALTTISEPLAELVARLHGRIPAFSVPNSFDPEDWRAIPFVTPTKCTLVYAGSMRDPSLLFQALSEELGCGAIDRNQIELDLYTTPVQWLDVEIAKYKLADVVRVKGIVPRTDVLRVERSSSANVLLQSFLPGEESFYTGKLFEYLGARRPIIAVGPRGSIVGELLEDINGGVLVSTGEEARIALRRTFARWQTNPDQRIPESRIERYTAPVMARRFAEILNRMVDI